MISDYKKCPRYFYLRHNRGWARNTVAMPLIFGSSWHEAMDAVWAHYQAFVSGKITREELIFLAMTRFEAKWTEEGLPAMKDITLENIENFGARIPTTAMEMLGHYIDAKRHILERAEILAIEQPFAIPLYGDRDDRWYIGRLDKVIRFNGDQIVIEHKTTSEYAIDGGFKRQYINSFSPNSQVEGYMFAANIYYPNTRYVWIDAALVHKKVHDAFKFIPLSHTPIVIESWLVEVRNWSERIAADEASLVDESDTNSNVPMRAFPRNTGECIGKYGECQFRNICHLVTNPHAIAEPPEGYKMERWEPFETLGLQNLGVPK